MQPSELRPPSLTRYSSYLATQVAKAAGRLLTEGLAAHGVRLSSYAVLASLADHGAQCQRELCDRLDLDKSHMVGFVDELEDHGFVERQSDPDDRRRHRVAITAAGARALQDLHDVEVGAQRAVFGVLSDTERATLCDLLSKVVESVDAARLDLTPEDVSA